MSVDYFMSMPETLTIYKVQFDEGHLLSFIAPNSGYVDDEDYIQMKRYNADVGDLHTSVCDLLDEIHQLKEEKLSLKDEVYRLNDEREMLFNRIECLEYRLSELGY